MGVTSYWISIIFLYTFQFTECSRVELVSNAYRDVTVSLPNASPQNRQRIIETVKDLFDYSSRVLYVVTKRRVTFKNIILLIPDTWSTSELQFKDLSITKGHGGAASYRDSDVIITDSLDSKYPYSLQAQGCGRTGLRIYLPLAFLLSNSSIEDKSVQFIHYWSQYRYGVFPEGGFPKDTRYPLYYGVPGTGETRVTSCTNIQLLYNATDYLGNECHPEVNHENGKIKGEECQIFPYTNKVDWLASSIMYQQALPQISRFCDSDWSLDKRHVPDAPSKHNALCFEEGTWFVILRNKDFSGGRNLATKYKPTKVKFDVVQDSRIRIVLAMDVSSRMRQRDRLHLLKNAFTKFLLFDIPLGSELGAVYFDNSIKVSSSSNLTLLSTVDDKYKFLEESPFFDDDVVSSNTCVECALNFSIELLQKDDTDANGIIVLILGGPINLSNKKILEKNLYERGIRLEIIHFSNVKDTVELPVIRNVQSVSIPEANLADTNTFLYTSLASSIANVFWNSDDHSYVMTQKLPNLQTNHTLSFYVDRSASSDLTILISGLTFTLTTSPLVEDATTLTSSSQEKFRIQKDGYIPAWIFSIHSAQTGTYILNTRRKENRFNDVFVSVFGKPKKDKFYLSLKSWTDAGNDVVPRNVPVKVFAELRYGVHPIYDANVTAIVYDPNNVQIANFDLSDDGLGDPDITKHDGIFTRYFTRYSVSGYYTVIVRAQGIERKTKILYMLSSYCCGSVMPVERTGEMEPFSRIASPSSFYLKSYDKGDVDVYPPSRILDLSIEVVDLENMTYVLTWTTVGDNYDNGTAESYRLKIFSERGEALRRFEDTGTELHLNREIIQTTDKTDNQQEYTVRLPEIVDSGYYFFAVKGVDNANNTGNVSNIVEAYVNNTRKYQHIICEDDENGDSLKLCSCWTIFVFLIVTFIVNTQTEQ